MEATTGAALGRRVHCRPGATALLPLREPGPMGWMGRRRVSVRPRGNGAGFADEGHLRYYASPARCGGRKEEKEVVKRRAKLIKGLLELQAAGVLEGAVAAVGVEERKVAITEAADVLLARLGLLRAEEEEMKRKKKEEKAAMRAAHKQMELCDESESSEEEQEEMKMKGCGECKKSDGKKMKADKAAMKATGKQMDCDESEESSSSSSSESSDSDCEEGVADMSSLRTAPADAVPPTEEGQTPTPEDELNLPTVAGETEKKAEDVSSHALKRVPECRSAIPGDIGSSTGKCCSSGRSSSPLVMAVEAAAPVERIEVCMGGKCKKSGAMELMREFDRRVGTEGAVVGCKCMGKCRDGPNVRVRNVYNEGDEAAKAARNPLCIGVGLDDVGTIVANFFAEKKDLGLLAA